MYDSARRFLPSQRSSSTTAVTANGTSPAKREEILLFRIARPAATRDVPPRRRDEEGNFADADDLHGGIDSEHWIMEGSITTPYFYRPKLEKWMTPPEAAGGHLGTTRRYALENSLCEEAWIRVVDVVVGEVVVLSNGVQGFMWGRVRELEHHQDETRDSP